MSALTRIQSGPFNINDAVSIETLENMSFEERLLIPQPVETLFMDLPEVILPEFFAKLFLCGAELYQKKLRTSFDEGMLLRIKKGDVFLGLGRVCEKNGESVICSERLFELPPQPNPS